MHESKIHTKYLAAVSIQETQVSLKICLINLSQVSAKGGEYMLADPGIVDCF